MINSSVKLLFIISAIFIPILVIDSILQFIKYPSNNERVMLLSGGEFNSKEIGIRHFSRNSELKQAAIYDNEIEYFYKFKTDESGFRITYDCDIKNPNSIIAIAGDSFTEGQGSSLVWVSKIQNTLCKKKYKTINTAMAGYSIIGMSKSLKYAKNKLSASHAIVAITIGDILKVDVEMISNDECSVYVSRTNKCGDSATWWHLPPDLGYEEIVNFSQTKFKYGLKEVFRNAKIKIKKHFSYNEIKNWNNEKINSNIKAMNDISSLFGPKKTYLIILPTKLDKGLEVNPYKKNLFAKQLNIFLKKINKDIKVFDLRSCPLDKKHFHLKDAHPNEMGQKLISECAQAIFKI